MRVSIILGAFLILSLPLLSLAQASDSRITEPINLLFQSYKKKSFAFVLPYTTGQFRNNLMAMSEYQNTKKEVVDKDFSEHLEKFDIVATANQNGKAIVRVNWTLMYSPTKGRPNTYYKIISNEYHLIFQSSRWKIANSKYVGESYYTSR